MSCHSLRHTRCPVQSQERMSQFGASLAPSTGQGQVNERSAGMRRRPSSSRSSSRKDSSDLRRCEGAPGVSVRLQLEQLAGRSALFEERRRLIEVGLASGPSASLEKDSRLRMARTECLCLSKAAIPTGQRAVTLAAQPLEFAFYAVALHGAFISDLATLTPHALYRTGRFCSMQPRLLELCKSCLSQRHQGTRTPSPTKRVTANEMLSPHRTQETLVHPLQLYQVGTLQSQGIGQESIVRNRFINFHGFPQGSQSRLMLACMFLFDGRHRQCPGFRLIV